MYEAGIYEPDRQNQQSKDLTGTYIRFRRLEPVRDPRTSPQATWPRPDSRNLILILSYVSFKDYYI